MNPFKIDHTKKESTEYISFFSFFKGVLIFLIVCSLGFILLNAYHVMMRKQENIIAVSTDKGNNSSILTGIHITHHYKEQKVFSIQAKTASIKNKKIGFFRIGGLKQLELENMIVDYYEPHETSLDDTHMKTSLQKESHDLLSYFSKASHSLPIIKKRLAGFAAYHATIRYHHPDGNLTIISSPYMENSNDRQSLSFRKNVAIHFQDEILLCKNLVFDVKRSQIISNEKYTLINKGMIQKGKGIRMNLRLEVMP